MTPPADRRRGPFAVAGAILIFVCVAVARLPESFISLRQRHAILDDDAVTPAFVLLAAIAAGQAAYGTAVLLRPDYLERRVMGAGGAHESIALAAARTSAVMVLLTVAYGLGFVALTGRRGEFWVFALIALGQGAWYYRRCGRAVATGQTPTPPPPGETVASTDQADGEPRAARRSEQGP